LEEPSFRQLAAAPELISPSARVTTTTTVPASDPIDDASSVERVQSKEGEADIEMGRVLSAVVLVKRDSAQFAVEMSQLFDIANEFLVQPARANRPASTRRKPSWLVVSGGDFHRLPD
jgi:hypothetical protein